MLRQSTGLRNFKNQFGSVKQALQNGEIRVYGGASQPATADLAPTGTLLYKLTKNGSARTPETLASGTVTLTGTTGSIATVTVDGKNLIPQGAVAFNTSLAQTATDLAAAINLGLSSPEYTASAAGAVVTIKPVRGTGAGPNGFVVTGTYSGDMGGTYANMAGGVAAANGLSFGVSTGGALVKNPTEVWQGTAVADGTATWFRAVGSVLDADGVDASGTEIRLDGAIATSGAEGNFSGTTIVNGAVQTANSFSFTDPAS